MIDLKIPDLRPKSPNFSSGPCAKHPGYSLNNLPSEVLGRSHRSSLGKARLKLAIDKTRAVLGVPDGFRIGIVPASDTGAMEIAMWSLLGARPCTMLAWESFGAGWVTDVVKQLQLDAAVLSADYGDLPDLSSVDSDTDIVFTWNGTTSGVRVPNADWIAADRQGLTICDATSAAFAQKLDWAKLDVVTFSWQKVMGGEGAHGVLILGPRAVERLESYTPAWPLPKIFRLTKAGKLNEGIFSGATINTPSMLCVEDYLDTLGWAEGLGGGPALQARCDESLAEVADFVDATPWVDFLAKDKSTRSNTSVCLSIVDPTFAKLGEADQRSFVKAMTNLLERDQVAFDIGGYRDAPPGLRIWCGATVEPSDVKALMPWLDYAFHKTAQA